MAVFFTVSEAIKRVEAEIQRVNQFTKSVGRDTELLRLLDLLGSYKEMKEQGITNL